MPCSIFLRADQSLSQRAKYSSDKVTIFAPLWVREGLRRLQGHLIGSTFILQNKQGKHYLEQFEITKFSCESLKTLERIARCESSNVSGEIDFAQYPDIKDKRILYSLRDLVRQCVIVGIDHTSKYGGYPRRHRIIEQERNRVYICDLAALQFQQNYNTGRLILIKPEEREELGFLDDFIFEKVVGEKKKSYTEVTSIHDLGQQERYIANNEKSKITSYTDKKAYSAFVKHDVVLSGLSICETAERFYSEDKINFKFLKYGTGFFAGEFVDQIAPLILPAVLDGVEELMGKPKVTNIIKQIELPFYDNDSASSVRISRIKNKYGLDIILTMNDALKKDRNDLITATTNCGDNHAVLGNEMGYASVDAAIAENLESKGNIFSPNINMLMNEYYIEV